MRPAEHLPAGNWRLEQPFYARLDRLLNGQEFDRLRLWSTHFTGWPLYSFGNGEAVTPESSAEAIDANLARSQLLDRYPRRWHGMCAELPVSFQIGPPAKFGEIGARVYVASREVVVNQDTLAYFERLTLMRPGGLLELEQPNIVEIGGGFGGLAYYLVTGLHGCRYTIVDLPESLLFSAIYLPIVLNIDLECEERADGSLHIGQLRFVPNFSAPNAFDRGVDLAINTLSMAEMTEPQVRSYCAMLRPALGARGVFFEQNHDNRHLGMLEVSSIIADYFAHCQVIDGRREQGLPRLWRN
jgi:hypothetical protein